MKLLWSRFRPRLRHPPLAPVHLLVAVVRARRPHRRVDRKHAPQRLQVGHRREARVRRRLTTPPARRLAQPAMLRLPARRDRRRHRGRLAVAARVVGRRGVAAPAFDGGWAVFGGFVGRRRSPLPPGGVRRATALLRVVGVVRSALVAAAVARVAGGRLDWGGVTAVSIVVVVFLVVVM